MREDPVGVPGDDAVAGAEARAWMEAKNWPGWCCVGEGRGVGQGSLAGVAMALVGPEREYRLE